MKLKFNVSDKNKKNMQLNGAIISPILCIVCIIGAIVTINPLIFVLYFLGIVFFVIMTVGCIFDLCNM